jgi:hypothetical protein
MASTETGAVENAPAGPRADGHRGGRGGRGRGRGRGGAGRGRGRGGAHNQGDRSQDDSQEKPQQQQQQTQGSKPLSFKTKTEQNESAAADDAEVCFICANPVSHYAVTPCGHVTCHICALRLRALYKSKDCPHCRVCCPEDWMKEVLLHQMTDLNLNPDKYTVCHFYGRP